MINFLNFHHHISSFTKIIDIKFEKIRLLLNQTKNIIGSRQSAFKHKNHSELRILDDKPGISRSTTIDSF